MLRMPDSAGRSVPAKALFSAAERYRMMPQIDRWVVSTSLAKLAEVREFVEEQEAPFSQSTCPGRRLGDDDILEFIEDEIRAEWPAGLVAMLRDYRVSRSFVSRQGAGFIDHLRSLGCTIALDDFGAGLSSFAYLKNFNVDTLKIDGGFIRDIADNRISESMVAAITQVAKVMDLETVAEYVETEDARAS